MRSALQRRPAQLTLLRTCRAARLPAFEDHKRVNHTDNEQPRPFSNIGKHEQQHWLDRRFPGLREWLEGKNRRWWLTGVSAWCSKYPALQGQEDQLKNLIEQAYQQFYAKHEDRLTDERSQTHLQVACLVLATYKTLLPWIKNQEELADIIRAHMGEQISPALRFLLRSTLYLSPNPYKTMSNRLRSLQLDYGKGFTTDFTSTEQRSQLVVTSCLYQDIFVKEDVPQLTMCCCCSQDQIWFQHAASRGVGFARDSTIAHGNAQCSLEVQRLYH